MAGCEIPDNQSQKRNCGHYPHPKVQHQDALMMMMRRRRRRRKRMMTIIMYMTMVTIMNYLTLAHFSPPQGRPIIDV